MDNLPIALNAICKSLLLGNKNKATWSIVIKIIAIIFKVLSDKNKYFLFMLHCNCYKETYKVIC